MTWRRAHADDVFKCGYCAKPIAKDAPFLETSSRLIRCKACAASWGETPPEVIEEERPSVPAGVRHQQSLAFGESTAALADQFRQGGAE